MRRSIFLFVLFFLGAGHFVCDSIPAQEMDDYVASPFAVTPEEKGQLLEKAEKALSWFRTMNRDEQNRATTASYRFRISPMELMQAAAILKEQEKSDMSRMLREMLPFFGATSEEYFEIGERLGDDMLAKFQEDQEILYGENAIDSVTKIRQGEELFLKDNLKPSEQLALIESPKSAEELMRAIGLLSVSGRPMLVRYYLRRFLNTEGEPEEYARIVDEVGSRSLMQIAQNVHFAPQGEKAVARIFAEAKKHWRDPDVVSEALDAWEGTDEDGYLTPESKFALHALWKGERVSMARLVDKLDETTDSDEVDALLAVLLSFGDSVREILSESLRSENTTLVENAVRGLELSIPAQDVFLLYPVLYSVSDSISQDLKDRVEKFIGGKLGRKPAHKDAIAALYTRANDYYEKNRPLKSDADGYVRFWNWNETDEKPRYIRMLVPAAYRLYAWRYASQAYRITPPDHPQYDAVRRLYLSTLFERTVYRNGLDRPLDPEESGLDGATENLSASQLEWILRDAMEKEHYAVARVAATLLGRGEDAEALLNSKDGRPRVLVRATASPDRRLRFAALEAVMNLNPQKPYPGSSMISDALAWFSRADGRRVLVSADPKQAVAAKTAGYFIGCGYKGEIAVTSRETMQKATESPDVELVIVDMKCSQPSVPNFVQQMRSDIRTHDLPIAVLSDDSNILRDAADTQSLPSMEKVDRVSADNPFGVSLSKIYPPVVSEQWAKWVDKDLFEKTGAEPVPPAVRVAQARKALDWIRQIVQTAEEGPKIYHIENLDDIVNRALKSDVRVIQGLQLAAEIKSAVMQAMIYEIAADVIHPMTLREQAAECFTHSVGKHGILLRGKQVQRLYDRYNDSEFEPEETQKLLGRMIDLIEDKTFGEEE